MTRIIFSVNEDLHAKFKAYCAEQAKDTMTNVLIRLIKNEIGYKEPIKFDNYTEVLKSD